MKRLVGSMFAGLMMAGMVASAVFAQESGRRRRRARRMSWTNWSRRSRFTPIR